MPPQYQHPLPSKQTILTRYGGWIPADRAVYKAFFDDLLRTIDVGKAHNPAVQAFKDAVDADPELVDLFEQTFLQVSPQSRIKTFDELLHCMDQIIVAAPKFQVNRDENGGEIIGGEPVGVPLYLLFDLLSNTGAGYDLLRKVKLNTALKDLLNVWGDYLQGANSNNTLNESDEGWFGKLGLASLEKNRGIFNEIYECPDYAAPNRGFASWDAFFTRKFKPDARPIPKPDPPFVFIYNACESTVYGKQTNIKEHDQFWLKGQPYSIYDILGRRDDEVARSFIGGTVYQAFLSPQDYHRWHSPVDGTIRSVQVIPGTYYAALPDDGAGQSDPDFQPGDPRGAIIRSQSWLTVAATRAVIYIEADNKDIGLIVFVGVGMVEVSTCDITVKKDDRVFVGDEIGMFHFGGSSHALIFGPDVKLKFFDHVQVNNHLHVNTPLAGLEI
ncbi:phosphatidylserine decarboxylase-domain-containing protein [Lentinula aff. detonsa]|nr:phosphatidylserine decarboxylase-domain-containing protein [Lentinula aff. detonsa]